jgi:hypothetical protein
LRAEVRVILFLSFSLLHFRDKLPNIFQTAKPLRVVDLAAAALGFDVGGNFLQNGLGRFGSLQLLPDALARPAKTVADGHVLATFFLKDWNLEVVNPKALTLLRKINNRTNGIPTKRIAAVGIQLCQSWRR